MNERFFKQTVTLFLLNKDTDKFDRLTIKKVYFRHNKKSNLIDKGLEKGSTGTLIIPTKMALIDNHLAIYTYKKEDQTSILDFVLNGLLTDKTWNLNGKSYAIEGEIKQDLEFKQMIKDYQTFRIISVDDNRKGNLQHLKLGVSE